MKHIRIVFLRGCSVKLLEIIGSNDEVYMHLLTSFCSFIRFEPRR